MSSWFVPEGVALMGSDGTQGPFPESLLDASPPGGVGDDEMTGEPLTIRTWAKMLAGTASSSAQTRHRTKCIGMRVELMFSGFMGRIICFRHQTFSAEAG